MKGKNFTYILMVCVAAVWGIIFYRIYAAVTAEDTPIAAINTPKTAYFNLVNHQQDPVQLGLDYRDPFSPDRSGFVEEKIVIPIVPSTNRPQVQPMPKQQVNWTGVIYSGYINNPTTKQKLAILSVNGKEVMLAEGQNTSGLKLIKHLGDSVRVQYQGETRYIRIK